MEERVRIPFLSEDDEGKWLEAVCAFQESPVALVFTHPYAPLGGDMDNNVVVKLSRYFWKGLQYHPLQLSGCSII